MRIWWFAGPNNFFLHTLLRLEEKEMRRLSIDRGIFVDGWLVGLIHSCSFADASVPMFLSHRLMKRSFREASRHFL